MINTDDLIVAFAIGLSGSIHCAGMCGPLAAALNAKLSRPGARSKLLFSLQYNLGRLLVYSFLGALAGLVGGGLVHSTSLVFIQKGVAIFGGTLIIFIGLSFLNLLPGRHFFEGGDLWEAAWFKKAIGPLLKDCVNGVPAGLLMGLLPCGMVYALLAKAASSGHPLQGWLLMICFGGGTLPVMAAAGLASRLFEEGRGNFFLKMAYVFIVLMGVFTIKRGLDSY
jgi:hypothetical protein